MRVVVALGGNALSVRGQALTGQSQRASIRVAAASLAKLLEAGHQVVITHGNGPQVGYLALHDNEFPLDVLDAEIRALYSVDYQANLQIQTVAWMCRALSSSRNAAYQATLEEVAANAGNSKVRNYARKYLKQNY